MASADTSVIVSVTEKKRSVSSAVHYLLGLDSSQRSSNQTHSERPLNGEKAPTLRSFSSKDQQDAASV